MQLFMPSPLTKQEIGRKIPQQKLHLAAQFVVSAYEPYYDSNNLEFRKENQPCPTEIPYASELSNRPITGPPQQPCSSTMGVPSATSVRRSGCNAWAHPWARLPSGATTFPPVPRQGALGRPA